jgi:hypothetical protein
MTYAHQGVELRQLPGLPAPQRVQVAAEAGPQGEEQPHPALLTKKATQALTRLEQLLDEADRALAAQPGQVGTLGSLDSEPGARRTDTLATAADQKTTPAARGN